MRTPLDAIVIGAGPAGSTAALLLARAGWAVALVEKQRFPRRKVCGECIAASNLPLLDALGVGDAVAACAGPALRHVALLRGDQALTADLPAATHPRHPWGRALGRETLDSLLLEQARAAGAHVLQPWSVRAVRGQAGAWLCDLRAVDSSASACLRAPVVIDAHGSWEDLPVGRAHRRLDRGAGDLFAFKVTYSGTSLNDGVIKVLALDGGYGGMVVADGGLTTVACCVRRDRLNDLRCASPGMRAGDAVEAWLTCDCSGVRDALRDASRSGHWLASGPIVPGVRLRAKDGMFRIGNAAGEAHPILGEGMSMALQSAALLCSHLLRSPRPLQVQGAAMQADQLRRYETDWHRHFVPRLRMAAAFAHAAMRPGPSALLMALVRAWPGVLTAGARWGGKVRPLDLATLFEPPAAAGARDNGAEPTVPAVSRLA